jgi:hypothetical protein
LWSTTAGLFLRANGATQTVLYSGGALGTPASGSAANLTSFPTLNQNTTGSAASISISGQSGLLTFTGLTSTNRAKTVRDAADTMLEQGGGYTPTGTWVWTSCSGCTWPTFNQNTSGTAANLSGTPALPNGTTATTQAANSADTKLATDAYADALVPALTYYVAPIVGQASTSFNPSGSANHITGVGVYIPSPVTFSNIIVTSGLGDANATYGMALITTSGTAICSTSSGVAIATTNTNTTFACSQGSVTIQPGNYILTWTTAQTSSIGKFVGLTTLGDAPTFFSSTNIAGCTATSGAYNFSSPCTISLSASLNTAGQPNFMLH